MKIEELVRPGLVALGVVGITATALLGFAVGVAVSRDPEALRRTARRVAGAAALGIEHATLMAAQLREHVGDLWAEAREAAVVDTDAADFERAKAAASKAQRAAANATATPDAEAAAAVAKPARKRATRPRKARAPKAKTS
jgi:microcystin-dependent protein